MAHTFYTLEGKDPAGRWITVLSWDNEGHPNTEMDNVDEAHERYNELLKGIEEDAVTGWVQIRIVHHVHDRFVLKTSKEVNPV